MLTKYRASINPPYSKKDLPIILGTIILIVGLALAVSMLVSPTTNQDLRGRAEKPQDDVQGVIGNPVSSTFSNLVQLTSPAPNSTVSLPLTIQATVDPTLKPTQVEFWKDNDKEPFAILYEPLDDTQGKLYEAQLTSLRPGKHTIHVNAVLSDDNISMSQEISFDVN